MNIYLFISTYILWFLLRPYLIGLFHKLTERNANYRRNTTIKQFFEKRQEYVSIAGKIFKDWILYPIGWYLVLSMFWWTPIPKEAYGIYYGNYNSGEIEYDFKFELTEEKIVWTDFESGKSSTFEIKGTKPTSQKYIGNIDEVIGIEFEEIEVDWENEGPSYALYFDLFDYGEDGNTQVLGNPRYGLHYTSTKTLGNITMTGFKSRNKIEEIIDITTEDNLPSETENEHDFFSNKELWTPEAIEAFKDFYGNIEDLDKSFIEAWSADDTKRFIRAVDSINQEQNNNADNLSD